MWAKPSLVKGEINSHGFSNKTPNKISSSSTVPEMVGAVGEEEGGEHDLVEVGGQVVV